MEHIENATQTALPSVRSFLDAQGEARRNVLDSLYEKGRESDHFQRLVDSVVEAGGVNTNESSQNYTDPILKAVATIMLEEGKVDEENIDADDPRRANAKTDQVTPDTKQARDEATQDEIEADYSKSNKDNNKE